MTLLTSSRAHFVYNMIIIIMNIESNLESGGGKYIHILDVNQISTKRVDSLHTKVKTIHISATPNSHVIVTFISTKRTLNR